MLTYFGADNDHQIGYRLTVVDENGFNGAIQHANAQCSHFALKF